MEPEAESDRPYVIIVALPGQRPKAIGRTYHRDDADKMVRFLNRYMTRGVYYVVFAPEPPEPPMLPESK